MPLQCAARTNTQHCIMSQTQLKQGSEDNVITHTQFFWPHSYIYTIKCTLYLLKCCNPFKPKHSKHYKQMLSKAS